MNCRSSTPFLTSIIMSFMSLLNSSSIDQVAAQLNIVVAGLLDSISVHKTFPLLVNNGEISWLTFKIFAANSCLLVGSVVLYDEAILPGLTHLRSSIVPDDLLQNGNTLARPEQANITRIIFYSFFVAPIYLICYSCSVIWYQSLADYMYKAKKASNSTPLVKAVVDSTYATVAWLALFIQVQLLSTFIPMLLSYFLSFLASRSLYDEMTVLFELKYQNFTGGGFISLLLTILRSFLILFLKNCILLFRALGLFLMSVLYGWYGFDPHWIATNVNPDSRFLIIEKHWAYFLGFGAPYVVLVKTTGFFVGYGWFLALFPFCIMLGGICDYSLPYKSKALPQQPLRIFKIAQSWTLLALQVVGKNARISPKSVVNTKGKKHR